MRRKPEILKTKILKKNFKQHSINIKNFTAHTHGYFCPVTKEVVMETKLRGPKICPSNGFGIIHIMI